MLFITPILLSLPLSSAQGGGLDFDPLLEKVHQDGGFGTSIAASPDLNGDGINDFLVGAPGVGPYGSAFAYSGANLEQIAHYVPSSAGGRVGVSICSIGDLDSDGIADVAVADGGSGNVFFFSGTGDLLDRTYLTLQLGSDAYQAGLVVHGPGDLTGDGIPDLAVGAPFLNLKGAVYILSGSDGSVVQTWHGGSLGNAFGCSIDSLPDQNGDGIRDLLVGDKGGDRLNAYTDEGLVHIISGASGVKLDYLAGPSSFAKFGTAVANAGDVNQDGFEDVLVSAPYHQQSGAAYLYSGADWSVLRAFSGEVLFERMGVTLSNAGDLDGDGVLDQAIGSPMDGLVSNTISNGRIRAFSGLTGELIFEHIGYPYIVLASAIAHVADGPGGRSRLVYGARNQAHSSSGNKGGAVYSLSWHPFMTASTEQVSSAAGVDAEYELDFPDAAAGYDFVLLASTRGTKGFEYGIEIPLTYDHMVQRIFDGVHPLSPYLSGTLDADGKAEVQLIGSPGGYGYAVGQTLYLAAIAMPIGGLPEFSSIAVPLEVLP